MKVNPKKTKLTVLEDDFETMRDSLAPPLARRAFADLIDCAVAAGFALFLTGFSLNPLLAISYFLVRDLIPFKCSIGKLAAGLRLYNAKSFERASSYELVIRGLANAFIVVPVAIFGSMFIFLLMAFFMGAAFLVYVTQRNTTISLVFLGYENLTGRTIADWIAGTHLLLPRDLLMLSRMRAKINQLKLEVAQEEEPAQG